MAMRVTPRFTSYRYDGNNDEELVDALNEDCGLVSASPQQIIVYGMDGQNYTVPVTGYLVVDTFGWPVKGMSLSQYEKQYTEVSSA